MGIETFIFWLALSMVGVVASGLFSGLETGVYSLNRVRLHLLSHRNNRSAQIMEKMLSNPGPMLATLLIGTNIATNLATSAMGVLFKSQSLGDWQIVGAVVLIETPLLLVFAETLPKDLFAAHADRLVYPFARPILWLKQLFAFTGLLPLITAVSHLCMKSLGGAESRSLTHPRRLMAKLVKEGLGRGLLSDEQSAIVERVMALADRSVADHMTPWDEAITMKVDATPQELWALAEEHSHKRLPVVDSAGAVAGVLDVTEAMLHDKDACPPIGQLISPAHVLPSCLGLREALRQMQDDSGPLAIVSDGDKPLGIVTVKDLIEPITGELPNW